MFKPMNPLQETTWVLVTQDGQNIIGGEDRNKALRPVEEKERIMYYKFKSTAMDAARIQYPEHDLRPAKVRVYVEEILQDELEE